MGANVSACCADSTAERLDGGTSSSDTSSDDIDDSDDGGSTPDRSGTVRQSVVPKVKTKTKGLIAPQTGASATSVEAGSATVIAFPPPVADRTSHASSQTRNPLTAPTQQFHAESGSPPLASPTVILSANERSFGEGDVVSQRRGAMLGVVEMMEAYHENDAFESRRGVARDVIPVVVMERNTKGTASGHGVSHCHNGSVSSNVLSDGFENDPTVLSSGISFLPRTVVATQHVQSHQGSSGPTEGNTARAFGGILHIPLNTIDLPPPVEEETIVVVKRHTNSSYDGTQHDDHAPNPLSPGTAPLYIQAAALPVELEDLTELQTGLMVPQLVVVEVAGQLSCEATSLRRHSTASGSRRISFSHDQQGVHQQQPRDGSSHGGSGRRRSTTTVGSESGGSWSSRESSPFSSVSSASSLFGEEGDRQSRRRRSLRHSSHEGGCSAVPTEQKNIRRASRPQRTPNSQAMMMTAEQGAPAALMAMCSGIVDSSRPTDIVLVDAAVTLRNDVERLIGNDSALVTILSQNSLRMRQFTAAAMLPHPPSSSATENAGAPVASSTLISADTTEQSYGFAATEANNTSLKIHGLAPFVAPEGVTHDACRRQHSPQASSTASTGGLVVVPSGANASVWSYEGSASLQTPGGYLSNNRVGALHYYSSGVGQRSPNVALAASSHSSSQHASLGHSLVAAGVLSSFQSGGGGSQGRGGGAGSPSYASDPQLFPSSGAPTTSTWGMAASGVESQSGYTGNGALEDGGQSGPLLRMQWTNSLLMRMAHGGGVEGSSLPTSGLATPVACA
jgi:hypothetical protein